MSAMSRSFRAFAAVVSILAFLFAQAATSAYACMGPATDPAAMAQIKADMGDAGGLCERHCTTGTVSFDLAKPAPSAMPAIAVAPLRIVVAAAPLRAVPQRAKPLCVAGPAPPLIRFTVLRI